MALSDEEVDAVRQHAEAMAHVLTEIATGRFTKIEVLEHITELGLRTRRGLKVSPQTFDAMLENRLYIGIIDVPDYDVHSRPGTSIR